MDENVKWVLHKRVERTIENLEKNNMKGYFLPDEQRALEKIKELMKEGDRVSVGGSMTLFEIGAIDMLRKGDYVFLDRYKEGLTPEEIKNIYRNAFLGDVYLTSSNAITQEGELYNVDGRGNRVGAMIYGPDKVIVVVGINKLVKNLQEAIDRNKYIAAPANNVRLKRQNPCAKLGYCVDCNSPQRICNNYVVIKKQLEKDRIHVLIVNRELGY